MCITAHEDKYLPAGSLSFWVFYLAKGLTTMYMRLSLIAPLLPLLVPVRAVDYPEIPYREIQVLNYGMAAEPMMGSGI